MEAASVASMPRAMMARAVTEEMIESDGIMTEGMHETTTGDRSPMVERALTATVRALNFAAWRALRPHATTRAC